ncbi:spore germination protein [Peribacillus deserti]|uniref:Spore germination protein n=1 Tax=Peribacillus deserti TaxID=673318 RepID=A0ABS2QM34_9BACI|nr:spore germination protein [Peribacillus deserti]MBM7694233.1 spore germination protein [Peribacillus deserti]
MAIKVKTEIEKVHEWLKQQLEDCADVEDRELSSQEKKAKIIYLKSVTDSQLVNRFIVTPFYEMKDIQAFMDYIVSFPAEKEPKDQHEALSLLLKGFVIIFAEGKYVAFQAKKMAGSGVTEASAEVNVQGSPDAFTENLEVNLNLIRHRYQTANLKVELNVVGSISQSTIGILYDSNKVDKGVLQELKDRLKTIDMEVLITAGELEQKLAGRKFDIFPTMVVTERPDRMVKCLEQGKICLILDKSKYAIILPSVFQDFFAAMDDRIQLPLVGWFLKTIRYAGLVATLSLPAFYVAFASYNPEILRVQLTLMIAGSRATVPYPAVIEVFLMLIMVEFLIEASIRLPKTIGPTATTVGGLILGTAATEAGLVGNIMIILVSAVAITNFVIPINMMNFSVRVLRYGFLFLASLFGLVGIVLGFVGIVVYLAQMRSFGRPYFNILADTDSRKGKSYG